MDDLRTDNSNVLEALAERVDISAYCLVVSVGSLEEMHDAQYTFPTVQSDGDLVTVEYSSDGLRHRITLIQHSESKWTVGLPPPTRLPDDWIESRTHSSDYSWSVRAIDPVLVGRLPFGGPERHILHMRMLPPWGLSDITWVQGRCIDTLDRARSGDLVVAPKTTVDLAKAFVSFSDDDLPSFASHRDELPASIDGVGLVTIIIGGCQESDTAALEVLRMAADASHPPLVTCVVPNTGGDSVVKSVATVRRKMQEQLDTVTSRVPDLFGSCLEAPPVVHPLHIPRTVSMRFTTRATSAAKRRKSTRLDSPIEKVASVFASRAKEFPGMLRELTTPVGLVSVITSDEPHPPCCVTVAGHPVMFVQDTVEGTATTVPDIAVFMPPTCPVEAASRPVDYMRVSARLCLVLVD